MKRLLKNVIKSASVLLFACLLGQSAPVMADAMHDWDILKRVRRIAIITPYFDAEALSRKPQDEKEKTYQANLRDVKKTFQEALPKCLAGSEQFQVTSAAEVNRALAALHWKPGDLFRKPQAKAKSPWPTPDLVRAAKLAQRLKVDAVFLSAMREPSSIKEGFHFHHETWNANPLNWSLRHVSAHINSPNVQATFITKNAQVAWQDAQMASCPRTKPATMRTLQADLHDATVAVAQQLTDSLLRLPPPDKQP